MDEYVPNSGSNQVHSELFSTPVKSEINLDIKQEPSDAEDVKINVENSLLRKLLEAGRSGYVKKVTANENVVSGAGPQKCPEQITVKLEPEFCEVKTLKCEEIIKKEGTYDLRINEEVNQENVLDYFESVEVTCDDSRGGESIQMYKCKFCEYRTKVKQVLLRHFTAKHDENAEFFHCDICEYKTKLRSQLKQHKKLIHADVLRLFSCQMCDFKTKYKSTFQNHERAIHRVNLCYSCHICKDTFDSLGNLKTHLNYKHNEQFSIYECHHCQYTSMNTYQLKYHVYAKHNINIEWHKCHLCEHKSKTKNNLKKHIKNRHELSTVRHPCHFCSYETKYKSCLRTHMKTKHDPEAEELQCHLCNKTYRSKQNLKIHIYNKHVRLYQCAHCIYTTRLEYSLKRHVKFHHEWVLD